MAGPSLYGGVQQYQPLPITNPYAPQQGQPQQPGQRPATPNQQPPNYYQPPPPQNPANNAGSGAGMFAILDKVFSGDSPASNVTQGGSNNTPTVPTGIVANRGPSYFSGGSPEATNVGNQVMSAYEGGNSIVSGANATPHNYGVLGLNAAPGTSLGGSTALGGAVLPAAGVAAGAYVGGQQLSGVSNALQGNDLSVQEQAALALPTFGGSFLYNPVKDFFDSGKGKQQRRRDEARTLLANNTGVFADQSSGTFNLGNDRTFSSSALNGASYNIDWAEVAANPELNDLIGQADALTFALLGPDFKNDDQNTQSQIASEFYNIAKNADGDSQENLRGMAASANVSPWDLKHNILLAWQLPPEEGGISAQERDAKWAAIDKLYGIENTSGQRWEDTAQMTEEERKRNTEELSIPRAEF